MGEKINRNLETEGRTGPNTNPSTSPTSTSDGGRGRGRNPASTESDQKLPKLVNVEIPGADGKKEETKKGRGRPAGTTKKKKTAAPAKKGDPTQVSMLLLTVSGIMASRPGMEPFMLSMEEANQIAVPLSNIMAKNEAVAGIAGEYADHIALLIASVTIFIPKYLIWKSMQPKKEKKGEKHHAQSIEKGPTVRSDKQPSGQPRHTDLPQAFDGDLSQFLPAIAGI